MLRKHIGGLIRNRQGVAMVWLALGLFLFVAIIAIVIDLGHLQTVKHELQNAAEAGALAGARELFGLSADPAGATPLPPGAPFCTQATQTASTAAAANKSDNVSVTVVAAEVQLLHWDWPNNRTTANPSCSLDPITGYNAVAVTAQRTEASHGGVFLTLAQIFGLATADVQARATAAVGFASGLPPGPFWNIAMDKDFINQIKGLDPNIPRTSDGSFLMSPDKADNGGFCGPPGTSINASYLKNAIDGQGSGISMSDQVMLVNGLMGSVHMDLDKAIPKHSQTYTLSNGTTVTGWLVLLPVVDVNQYNQSTAMVSPYFQAVVLQDVLKPGDKDNPTPDWGIKFRLYDGPLVVIGGEPGGSAPGPGAPLLYAVRPKLVE